MQARPIDASFHVTGQIRPDTVSSIKEAGYAAIICMRPDNEGFNQPAFAEIKARAEAEGLAAYYLPVTPGSQPFKEASELKALLKQTDGPILAYCASGNRCGMLYQLAQQAG